MRAEFFLALLLIMCTAPTYAASPCPPTGLRMEWSAQCFEGKDKARRVKSEFLEHLQPNRYGMTTILISAPRELVAVDRKGSVVVPNIRHAGDFDYPTAQSGIGRFYSSIGSPDGRPAQCGYFEAGRFRIIAPPRFDHCEPFNEEQALACVGCTSYCTEPDCQSGVLVGGQGVAVARDGTQKMVTLPTLATVCTRPDLVRISRLSTGAAMLMCLDGQNDPFSKM